MRAEYRDDRATLSGGTPVAARGCKPGS
jgi:hypothetical protein